MELGGKPAEGRSQVGRVERLGAGKFGQRFLVPAKPDQGSSDGVVPGAVFRVARGEQLRDGERFVRLAKRHVDVGEVAEGARERPASPNELLVVACGFLEALEVRELEREIVAAGLVPRVE